MKKGILLSALLLAPIAQADSVLGLYIGGNVWQADYAGNLGEPSVSMAELGITESDNRSYYIALEHPLPMLPNIQLQKTNISSQQTTQLNKTFTVRDTTFSVASELSSHIDLSHIDLVLYYEVLDNWINLDLGLTARQFDGYANLSTDALTESVKIDDLIPMLYAKAQFDLPLTGFSLGGSVNTINYSHNHITDYSIFLAYTFDSALDIGAEFGYRSLELTLDKKILALDATLTGPYAGILLHF